MEVEDNEQSKPDTQDQDSSDTRENEEERNHDLDLPLSANRKEVFVHHYIINLKCDINNHIFEGIATFFVEGQEDDEPIDRQVETCSTSHSFILDCFAIEVSDCWIFDLTENDTSTLQSIFSNVRQCPLKINSHHRESYRDVLRKYQNGCRRKLPFAVGKHSIKIGLPHVKSWKNTQTIINIQYKTRPDGPCLMWTYDQDNRPCVFTIGDSLNNRSLFPSQDMPKAMSTWHCNISLPHDAPADMRILMTGENDGIIDYNENNERTFEYFSSLKMPMSTFALAIGCWSCAVLSFSILSQDSQESSNNRNMLQYPECRLFFPSSLEKSRDLFNRYLGRCFDAISTTIESFPLNRLDLLIVPECFDSLGLASPYLVFLSQSLLSDDLSMFHRVAHEICHTWFGILTGPSDWTEEWVTEGICCYLEDIIHATAMGWTDEEEMERNGLRAYRKYELLTAEIESTPDHLQLLRQEKGMAKSTEEEKFVRDGNNSEKSFMQVHYLKGFFLLKHLENIAGKQAFLTALKEFITQHLGLLFSSQELLDYFFTHCECLKKSDFTLTQVCQEWLDCAGLPQECGQHCIAVSSPQALASCPVNMSENQLYQDVVDEFEVLKKCLRRKRQWNQSSRTPLGETGSRLDGNRQFLPDQVVLLVDKFLGEGTGLRLSSSFLDSFRTCFIKDNSNAEILHAWCELVVQHKASKWFQDVEDFLLRNRAMGLYLYGEMIISENARLQSLALRCFHQCQASMPRPVLKELEVILGLHHQTQQTTDNMAEKS